MATYPNLVPLDEHTGLDIAVRVERFTFDRAHGGCWGRVVVEGDAGAARRWADRYVAHSCGERPSDPSSRLRSGACGPPSTAGAEVARHLSWRPVNQADMPYPKWHRPLGGRSGIAGNRGASRQIPSDCWRCACQIGRWAGVSGRRTRRRNSCDQKVLDSVRRNVIVYIDTEEDECTTKSMW